MCADVCCAQETEYTIGTVLNQNPEDTKDARMRIPSFLHFTWRMLVQAGQVCWVCAICRSWYQMHSSISCVNPCALLAEPASTLCSVLCAGQREHQKDRAVQLSRLRRDAMRNSRYAPLVCARFAHLPTCHLLPRVHVAPSRY